MERAIILIGAQHIPMEPPFKRSYNYSNCFNSDTVIRAGGIPLVVPFLEAEPAEQAMAAADGLFLSGGADVSPELYGEDKLPCCHVTEPDRDRADITLLKAALKLKKPVLCICRGFQLANVFLGGSLWQDINEQRPGSLEHSCTRWPGYTRPEAHSVRALPETPLYELYGGESFGVNSLHHQGIKTLAPGLLPMAQAPDGLTEAWFMPGEEQWLRGIQWHPEMLERDGGQKIFRAFISACLERKMPESSEFI